MREKLRHVAMVLAGVAVLIWSNRYHGPYETLVHSYAGNCSVSFAVYFLLRRLPPPWGTRQWLIAALALATVSLFEATDGFGVMANTYDPVDFLANAAGILLALAIDSLASRRK